MAAKTDHKPPVYWRARAKIVESIAIQQIADAVSEGAGDIAIPRSWTAEIDGLREHILRLIDEQSHDEGF